jgi:hypothetical protein
MVPANILNREVFAFEPGGIWIQSAVNFGQANYHCPLALANLEFAQEKSNL